MSGWRGLAANSTHFEVHFVLNFGVCYKMDFELHFELQTGVQFEEHSKQACFLDKKFYVLNLRLQFQAI